MLLFATGDLAPAKATGVKAQVRVKLIELPLAAAGITTAELQSGRLPEAGKSEILSGAKIEPRESLKVGTQSLKVVGVLRPGLALLADSFLLPSDHANDALFPAVVPTVFHAWLVRGSPDELRREEVRKPLEDAFPHDKYTWITPDPRLDSRTFSLYLSGLAIFLLGGSGTLIGFFRWLAAKVTSPALSGPLFEMKARPRLVWGVHLFYFGIVIAGSLLIAGVPEAQVVLLGKISEALGTKNSPLGVAAQAYLSGSFLRAAVVTFVINFLLGSLGYITVPSILVPFSAVLLAGFRAVLWGLLFAPTMQTLAFKMLPHSLTMLLEGEGYILATLFGLLVPIHVLKRSLGGNPFTRFGRAILLNVKAQFWIALVLAVAAIYEATEVILMNR